ncbi:MAG: L-seryl-tRNA(Sec) selenium transferase [Kiritimatiellia bacterium]
MSSNTDPRRGIPSVSALLECSEVSGLIAVHTRLVVLDALRAVIAEAREAGDPSADRDAILADLQARLARAEADRLRPVINATGILLHTGLGRAVLPGSAATALAQMDRCCNLQIDLETGLRGKRMAMCERLICELTGGEAAVIVNNNAAATLLILAALCSNQEVIVSRGELIEIGGSYRLPDCITSAGCVMREVGATNKTHLRDYEQAITERTGALLRVNPSNYRIIGFSQRVPVGELAALAHAHQLPLIDDLGCGAIVDLREYGLPAEPLVQDSIAAGADIVCFSGDKLIGGPQCGIIVGRCDLIERIKKHPLTRMLRVCKLTAASLEQALRLFRDPDALRERHPMYRMLARTMADLRQDAGIVQSALQSDSGAPYLVEIKEGTSEIGGGSLPGVELPTVLVAIRGDGRSAESIAKALRLGDIPVITRIQDGNVLLDMRTLLPGEVQLVATIVKEVLDGSFTS